MNIRNRKALNRLSFKSFLANKKQNIITIFAIVLTTLFFTSLFTVCLSLKDTFHLAELKSMGYSAHGYVEMLDESQLDDVRSASYVKDAGYSIEIGVLQKAGNMRVAYDDEKTVKYCFAEPKEGNMPKAANEVVMSKTVMEALAVSPNIGDKVTLDIAIQLPDSSWTIQTDEFVLSGISESGINRVEVSKEYVDSLINTLELNKNDYSVTYFEFKNDSNVYGKIAQMCDETGINAGAVIINPAFDMGSDALGEEGIVAVAVLVFIIMLTGFLIIYNIFQIIVGNKIRYYGLLKTIGVTSKQLRKIMLGETMFLCLVAIPLGLVIGYFVGTSLIPSIVASTTLTNYEIVAGFSPLVAIFASLFSLITVFISSFVPVRKASKVSPIEALRFNDAKVSTRPHKGNRTNIASMALANLGRNKTRTVLVIMSMALALVVFDTVCIFNSYIDPNEYIQASCPSMDFVVSTPECFIGGSGNYLTDDEINEVASHINSSVSGRSYISDKMMLINGDRDDMGIVVGFDESLSYEVEVVSGDLSGIFEKDSNKVAVVEGYGLKQGEKFEIQAVDKYWLKDKKTGELVDPAKVADDEFQNYEATADGKSESYEVCAVIKEIPSSFIPKFTYGDKFEYVLMSRDQLDVLSTGDVNNLFFCADASDTKAYDSAEEYLSGIDSARIEYSSLATIRSEFDQMTKMFKMIGGALCVIIGLVGVLNFINAILTGIISRKHELALLNAVGMTGGQTRKMLFCEGIFYSIFTILMAIPGAGLLNILMNNIELFWLAKERSFIVWPLLVILPIFLILSFVIPSFIYGRVRGKSIVDDLRTNE